MKKVAVTSLKEGQKFTKAVFIAKDNLFIPENIAVRANDIKLLVSLGIDWVYTEGDILLYGDGALAETRDGQEKEPEAVEAAKQIKAGVPETHASLILLINQINEIFFDIANSRKANIRLLWHITDSLLRLTKKSRNEALSFVLCKNTGDPVMGKNSIDSAILSAVMGQELGFDNERNQGLTAAAILHDIGMLRLPEDVVKKKEPLSDKDKGIIKSHTILSFNIMKKELMYSDSISRIALQHHEHWDGTGYPHCLSGNYINERALIVSVTDAFVAMINRKVYRNSMTGYQAMKTLVSENASYFSPDMLKLFVKIMGIYPIGSGVLLNDGRIAKILDVNVEMPLRPVVRIIADSNGAAIEDGKEINLLSNKSLFITRALDIQGIDS
ncbi:MAG: HD domain-containing protein [Spirochaetaceae bacterium]|jgi:HD-GYP domain-containing protein (c-di-GMP phosphodiesterase class II)|nr:HD domain-containing protein [Spirochaetaceae bacterium]